MEKQYNTALEKLNKGKVTDKNKQSLILSLNKIINRELPKRDSFIRSEQLTEKEQGVEINDYLLKKIVDAASYTGIVFTEKQKRFEEEGNTAKNILRREYFNQGKTKLNLGVKEKDKSLTKEAYSAFVKAEKYGSDNGELQTLKKKSLDYSKMVYNITTQSSGKRAYDALINDRFKQMEQIEHRFKEIHYQKTTRKGIDCLIEVFLDELIITTDTRTDNQQFSKEITAESEGNTAITKTVRGAMRMNKKIKLAYWDVTVNIQSNSGSCNLKNRRFREELTSEAIRVNLSGDERAIPERFKNIREQELLRDNEIAEELITRICKKIELYFE